MKLLTQYNRVNIVATIIALSVSGICYYFFIRYQLINQLDKDLKVEELEINDYVKINNHLPKPSNYKDQVISFEPTHGEPVKRTFASKNIFNNEDNEWATIREIIFPLHITGKDYTVIISKSQEETNHLIKLILLITSVIVITLLIILFFINRFLLNKLWLPFNTTLQQLKQFNLTGKQAIHLEKTGISEFADLNDAVTIMSSRVSQDYETLKSFTENASHEIQTPLAIIQSKLELLIQSENLNEEQVRHINAMHDACTRLSKLNQSLILLTKIDNQQFHEKTMVDMGDIICRHLNNYEELMSVKKIAAKTTISENTRILMNEVTAEILVSNLVTNAIKHNVENGEIDITLTPRQLVVCNTGRPLTINPAELFGRFKKDNHDAASLGLGLSIVQKICEQNNFTINYAAMGTMHMVTIQFTNMAAPA